MPRRTPPAAQLAGILDTAATRPTGAAAEASPERPADVEHQEQKQPPEQAPAATETARETPSEALRAAESAPGDLEAGKARRLNVRVPPAIRSRLERQQRRVGLSFTEITLDAYRQHGADLAPPEPAADDVDQEQPAADPLLLPDRSTLARARRRRHVRGVDLPLYVFSQERAVLEAAVTAGRALNLSDLVTRVLDLALPPAGRRSVQTDR